MGKNSLHRIVKTGKSNMTKVNNCCDRTIDFPWHLGIISFVKLSLIAFLYERVWLEIPKLKKKTNDNNNKETKKFLDLYQFQGTGLSTQPRNWLDCIQLVPNKAWQISWTNLLSFIVLGLFLKKQGKKLHGLPPSQC